MPDDEARISGVVVPDDISALASEIAAYRREVRRAERARRRRRLLARRGVVPAVVVTVAVVMSGVVAAMLTLMAPRAVSRPPGPAPLAAPNAAPGTLGGLLPSATLRTQGGAPVKTHSPTLRPEVFALVPKNCGCADILNGLAGQAYSENLRLAIVIPAATDDSAASLVSALDRGLPTVYYDPQATLATSIAGDGVTAVVVDLDGTIYYIEPDITDAAATSLGAELQSMLLPNRR